MTPRRLPTAIEDLVLIEPQVHGDRRGFFVETFRQTWIGELGLGVEFVQQNHSRSGAGVLRGIHMQAGQAKLVRCSRGRIWDVAVDLRPGSPTYRRWAGYELSDENHRQLFIPEGFGHGFCVLGESGDISYLLSAYYDPERESAVAWDDPEIGIDWPIEDPVLSDRDRAAPRLADAAAP